jgi:hypothetical protein
MRERQRKRQIAASKYTHILDQENLLFPSTMMIVISKYAYATLYQEANKSFKAVEHQPMVQQYRKYNLRHTWLCNSALHAIEKKPQSRD